VNREQRHIAFMLTSLSPTGGIERDAVKCMRALAKENFHIHLIVAFPHADMVEVLSDLPITWYRARTLKRPPTIGQVVFCIKTSQILKRIRRLHGDMDCVSFENLPPASILIGCTSQKLWRKARMQGGMGRSLRPLWNIWKSYSEKQCLLNARKIATYSEQVRQTFIQEGTPAEKLDRLIIPVDTRHFAPQTESPLHERREILIIGANPKLKGIDIMLAAWEDLSRQWPELSLRIVTQGWKVNALAKKFAAPRVTISPFISDPREYYNRARLVVAPSVFESWGNVVIEALSSGIPVITSTQVPSSEIIDHAELGLSIDRDGRQDELKLSEAITEVLNNMDVEISGMELRHQHVETFQHNNPEITSWIVNQASTHH